MKRSGIILGAILLLGTLARAEYRYPIGERATYKIQWGLATAGELQISCNKTNLNNQSLIHIRVRARSNWLLSSIYPIDETADCFIDPQTRHSVLLIERSGNLTDSLPDRSAFDRINNTVQWSPAGASAPTIFSIKNGSYDAVSFLYAFRQFHYQPDEKHAFDVVIDDTQHNVSVEAGGTSRKRIKSVGKVMCRRYSTQPQREHSLLRKIPSELWLTDDERKILTLMILKIPKGHVRLVLDDYEPPYKPM